MQQVGGHRRTGSEKVARLELIPRADDEQSTQIRPHRDFILVLRDGWQKAKSDRNHIKLFCQDARRFIELTLVTCINDSRTPVHDHPTLDPLRGRLIALTKVPGAPQSHAAFANLLALLPDGTSEKEMLKDALNWSSHFQADDLRQHHAEAVDKMLDKFLKQREVCLDILLHAPNATPTVSVPEAALETPKVIPFQAPAAPRGEIVRIGQIAAADAQRVADGEGEGVERIAWIDPQRHVTFAAGSAHDWLPSPIGPDTLLVAETEIIEPTKGALVIAWDLTTGEPRVGWCSKPKEGVVALSGVTGNFHQIYRVENVELRKVVGGFFGIIADATKPCDPKDATGLLPARTEAVEVTAGDSAEPLLRKGDYALVAPPARIDELSAKEPGYAFQLSDQSRVLKRLQRSHHRMGHRLLLPLSGQGDGFVVQEQAGEGADDLPRILSAHPLVGFWRR